MATQRRFIWVWLLVIALFLIGCTLRSTPPSIPPGANTIYGGVDVAQFVYSYWEEGLDILIWHDLVRGTEGCSGSGSSEDPVFRLECDVESEDGQTFSWKVHARDGVTGQVWIEDQSYDLSQGNMFLISTGESGLQIEQFQRDFSTLERSDVAFSALAENDRDVANFVAASRVKADR